MQTRFSLAALLVALLALAPASLAQSFSTQEGSSGITRSIGDATANLGGTILTHSVTQNVVSFNSVSCNAGNHTDNSYLRVFDLNAFGITEDFTVSDVTIGVEEAVGFGGTQPIELRLYTLSGPVSFANLTLLGTVATQVPDGSLVPFSFAVPSIVVPAGSVLAVEVFTPNGQLDGNTFFIGSNPDGETAPGYLAAADCGAPDFTLLADLGFPNMHMVMNVTGMESSAGPDIDIEIGSFGTPERGESVFFRGPLTNNGASPEDVYLYFTVDVPGTGDYKKNLGRKTVGAGETINFRVFKKNFVPLLPDAPAGTYTVTLYAASDRFGTVIYDQDSFSFELPPLPPCAGGCLTASVPTAASLEIVEPTAAPNPFRDATEIRYSLAEAGEVDLRVYDVTGREVAALVSGTMSAGTHAATLRAGDLPGGVYVWRLAIGGEVTTGRVTLAR